MTRKTLVKWLIGAGGTVLVVGAIFALSRGKNEMIVTTDVVHRGALVQTVDVTGSVEALEDIDLAFATSGDVADIFAQVGDVVSAGQTLAMLRSDDLSADIARAQGALDQALAGATDEEIAVSEAGVAVAQSMYDSAAADLAIQEADVARVATLSAATLERASLAAEQAQVDLDTTIAEHALLRAQARENVVLSFTGALVRVRGALADADLVLGQENALQNNACESQFGRQDPTRVSAAEFAFDEAAVARDVAEEALGLLSDTSTDAEIAAARLLIEDALNETTDTLLYVAQVLDATVADTASCSLDDINALKNTIETNRAAVQTERSALASALQAYDTEELSAVTQETQARNALALATQDFLSAQITEERDTAAAASAVTRARATLASRSADVAQAQASLAQVLASPRAVDLAALRADVSAAQARYAKSLIVAPIVGVVTDVAVDVGEFISAGGVMITLHAQEGQFKVPVQIPESDITKVAVGNRAEVTLDAFGDDTPFVGTLAAIDPAETLIEGVVFYEGTVVFDEIPSGKNIRSGMSADVTIATQEIADTLYIAQRAVLEEGGQKYLRIPTDDVGGFEKKFITVGLRGDDGLVEILSGIAEGTEVILSIKEK